MGKGLKYMKYTETSLDQKGTLISNGKAGQSCYSTISRQSLPARD